MVELVVVATVGGVYHSFFLVNGASGVYYDVLITASLRFARTALLPFGLSFLR